MDQVDPIVHHEGARERLLRDGVQALSDAELVSILLSTGTREEPVPVLAARVLATYGSPEALCRVGIGMLASMHGVGVGKASRIVAALELGRRASIVRPLAFEPITTSAQLHAVLRAHLAWSEVESFYVVPLDAKNRPRGHIRIAQGSVAACTVNPSDVFRAVVREAAVGVAFAHNHPSGDPTPSSDDVHLTKRLCYIARVLGVHVVDHVVLGGDGYFSFVDAGLLPKEEWP